MFNEMIMKVKAEFDDSKAKRQMKEFADETKKIGQSIKQDEIITDKDIQNFQKFNREFERYLKSMLQLTSQFQKTLESLQKANSGGGGTGSGGFGGGGFGGLGGSGGGFDGLTRTLLGKAAHIFSIYNLVKNVHQGMNLIRQEETYAAPLATRMGGYGSDFRRTRLDFNQIGDRYYIPTMEAMRVGNTYMSLAGVQNWRQNLNDIFYASRGMGLDDMYLAQIFGLQQRMTGGQTNLKQFAETLTGAIKQSGMQGRDQEMVDAINNLTQKIYEHETTVSTQQQNDLIGLMTYFSQKNPGFKGMKGAQLGAGLDSMLSDTNNPLVMMMMGYGTKYTGLSGMWALETQMSKGLTTQNLSTFITNLQKMNSNPDWQRIMLDKLLQQYGIQNHVDATNLLLRPDIVKDLQNGKTQDVLKKIQQSGHTDLAQQFQNYMNSDAAKYAQEGVFYQDVQKNLGEYPNQLWTGAMNLIDSNMPPWLAGALFTAGSFGAKGIFKGIGSLVRWGKGRFFGGGGGATPPKGTPPTGGGGGGATAGEAVGAEAGAAEAVGAEAVGAEAAVGGAEAAGGLAIGGETAGLLGGATLLAPEVMLPLLGLGVGAYTLYSMLNRTPAQKAIADQATKKQESPQDKLLNKQNMILKKWEDLLIKEEKLVDRQMKLYNGAGTATPMGAANLPAATQDPLGQMVEQVFGVTINSLTPMIKAISALLSGLFGGGNGGSGSNLQKTSYTSGGSGFTAMPLNDNFNMTPDEVNAWINKYAPAGSIMRGQGAAFVEAAKKTGLDVRYLVAHAALETAWGTSRIAKDKYNFYGIGAVDWNPYGGAKSFGRTPAEGIIAGAEWIKQNFIDRGQNTLYKMLHSPNHAYASDPNWDTKIASIMAKAPTATLNVNVSGSIAGLTPENNHVVATSLAYKIRQAPDLSQVFRLGQRAVYI